MVGNLSGKLGFMELGEHKKEENKAKKRINGPKKDSSMQNTHGGNNKTKMCVDKGNERFRI